jgi:FAD/FMN-containing dehydrogenase
VSDLLGELRARCGDAAVLSDPRDLEPYVTDWRGAFVGSAQAVVRPASTEETADVVRACARAGVPVVPQGGNTGLAAAATPMGLDRAVIVCMSRMRRVRNVDAAGFTIAVDAGCVLTDVHEAARAHGRRFPLSLAAEGSAQIGGLIATNAGGTAVLRYGTMRALVLGLEVVLADGRILDGMRALRKDNAGYDWKHLFVGSEGTLGIVTAAVLRLFPQPAYAVTALAGTSTPERAMEAFAALQERAGEAMSACELFPDDAMQLRIDASPGLERPMNAHPWYLLIEAESSLPGLADALETALEATIDRGWLDDCVVAATRSQARALWEWREEISESEKRAGPSAKHDVSVAVSAVPDFIERAREAVRNAHPGTRAIPFGHAGDGNIHFNVLLPRDGSVRAAEVNATVHRLVREFRGSITAEHGIGRYRRDELLEHRSVEELDVMRAIKHALDPSGIMNPGSTLPP